MPEISVIIPTYNRAHLISRSIQCVLNQSYQDFEIIVVDDCSIDNTEEVIREFQKKDERIRYIRHEKNKGPAAARNSGIKAAKGEYIAFQDSDDEWLPEKLYKHMMIFKKVEKKIGVVYSGFWKIRNGKKLYIPSPYVFQKEGNIHKELLKGNFIGMPASVVRKECFTKIGNFDIKIPYLEDWELWIRIVGVNVLNFIINKYHEDFNKHKKILSKHYFSIGLNLCLNNDLRKGRNYIVKAVRIDPFNIKFLTALLISFFGQSVYGMAVKIYRKIKERVYI